MKNCVLVRKFVKNRMGTPSSSTAKQLISNGCCVSLKLLCCFGLTVKTTNNSSWKKPLRKGQQLILFFFLRKNQGTWKKEVKSDRSSKVISVSGLSHSMYNAFQCVNGNSDVFTF